MGTCCEVSAMLEYNKKVDSAILNDACLHKGGSTTGKAEVLFAILPPFTNRGSSGFGAKNLVQQQCYLHFWLGK